jgi:outer membrane protein OmpA-like peptidoglycan-associated protein
MWNRVQSGIIAAAAVTMLSMPAFAQESPPVGYPVQGLYLDLGGGFNVKGSESIKNLSGSLGLTTGLSTPNLTFGTNVGPALSGAIGYGFGNGLRAEVQLDYAHNNLRYIDGLDRTRFGGSASIKGSEQLWGPMFNVLYDITGVVPVVVPYVGVGIGYQRAHFSNFGALGIGTAAGLAPTLGSNDTRASFAAQGILGAAFPVQQVPGLAITADYRIMALTGTRTYDAALAFNTAAGRVTRAGTMQVGHEYNNIFIFGVRYNFGVAPPPPPAAPAPIAAPAPAPARSYLVFFDWDKATLTDRARAIIKEAADNSTHVQYTRIEVNGYTDTSGTPRYNQGLSVRRAKAVQAELIRDGVPQSAIAIQGFGETHLLVPTGPGVREPQNRRVEIIIR